MRSDKKLWGILAAGFALRCAWACLYPLVLENEGSVYAALAVNLFSGNGLVSAFGGRFTLFPPLYPILIGVVSYATGSADTASLAVSAAMGSLLPVPVYLVAMRLFGRPAALAASALAAFHPMLIALSGSGYSEATYFTIWFFGLHFALRSLDGDGFKHPALAGLFFGMAYLIRPEALAYSALASVFIALQTVRRKQPPGRAFRRAATVLLVTAVLGAPYAAWLSINGGRLLIEGKSPLVNLLSDKIAAGKSYPEAVRGLGPDGEPDGVFLFADQFDLLRVEREVETSLMESVFHRFRVRVRNISREIWSLRILGSPVLVLLSAAGFLIVPLRNRKVVEEAFIASVAAAYLFMLLSLQWRFARYLFPLSLVLIPWAGAGMAGLAGAAREWVERRKGAAPSRFAAGAVCFILVAAIAVPCLPAVFEDEDFHSARFAGLREAGEWLAARGGERNAIMTNSSVLAFYSRGTQMYFPHAGEKEALGYIRRKNPRYLVLRADERKSGPYMEGWLLSGIPDPCAREVHRIRRIDELGHRSHTEEITIYEWACRGAAASGTPP